MTIQINSCLLKVIGVFSFDTRKDYKRFINAGFDTMRVVDLPTGYSDKSRSIEETKKFYKDTYYSEFRELMFTSNQKSDREGLQQKSIIISFHQWISEEILCGIELVGENLKVDEYSGSKFKIYSVFDLPNLKDSYNRDHLLYEIGTSSPIGTVSNNSRLKPTKEYFDELMKNKLGVFENYEGLALLDSFTVIGYENYAGLDNSKYGHIPHHQWNRAYFSIYIFNLYVRYNLFKFNAEFLSNPVKYRSKFQMFLNHYNFTHISFNFLPNIIFKKMREAMGIEFEIEKFEKRLVNLASSM